MPQNFVPVSCKGRQHRLKIIKTQIRNFSTYGIRVPFFLFVWFPVPISPLLQITLLELIELLQERITRINLHVQIQI